MRGSMNEGDAIIGEAALGLDLARMDSLLIRTSETTAGPVAVDGRTGMVAALLRLGMVVTGHLFLRNCR